VFVVFAETLTLQSGDLKYNLTFQAIIIHQCSSVPETTYYHITPRMKLLISFRDKDKVTSVLALRLWEKYSEVRHGATDFQNVLKASGAVTSPERLRF
jgi:hypothetical protein